MRALADTTNVSRPQFAQRLLRLPSCIRFDEVCVLQGAPLIGASFSIGTLTASNILSLGLVIIGSLCLVAHVFVLNDWAGIHGDLRDPARAARTFAAKGVSRAECGYLAIVLLVLALLSFWLVNIVTLGVAAAIASLSALYSAPAFHAKGRPFFNSLLHFAGGVLHFLLGYAAFAAIDARGILIGCFFALVFTAGHLIHEARGYEGDLLNGIRTNAVAFGRTPAFVASFVLFTAAYGLLIALAVDGAVPHVLTIAAVLYPIHAYASVQALRAGLTFDSLRRLQRYYRVLYAVIGIFMFGALSQNLLF